jgi:hypothetical protein
VRPTREGPVSPFRRGLLTVGLGVNPDAPDEDPEPPIDWAASSNQGQAFVPFLNSGDPAVVQYKTGTAPAFGAPVTVTLDAEPTIGNILVLCAVVDDDSGPVLTIGNGTWVQAGSTVYSGNGTNWPNRMYYQTVDAGTTAATTIDSSGGATDTGTLKVGIIELSGVDTIDQTASTTNSSTTTATLTPTAGQAAIIISAVARRTLGTNVLTPAGGMTEWAEIGASPFGLNYQVIESTSGGYTVGSTGASANSSMIAAAFIDTGVSLNWIDAPLAIDGDDATYEFVAQEHSPFLRHTLDDERIVDAARLVVAWTSNTSRTLTLQGANEADYSDAVTLDTHAYTPTGSLTADTLNLSWSGVTAYRYAQYLTDIENWFRVYESSLYQAGEGAASVASNALALGSVVVQNSAASNYHFVAVSSTAGYWLPHAADGEPDVETVAASGSTETINYDVATWWDITLTANCTFTITNPPDDQKAGQLVLILRQGGSGSYTVTWPASVEWQDTDGTSGGAAPTLFTAVGAVDVVTLVTVDGGVTWGGSHGAGSTSIDYAEAADIAAVGTAASAGVSAEVPRADHVHELTAALLTSMGVTGELLISDTPSNPIVYADILLNEDGTDFLYADLLELP